MKKSSKSPKESGHTTPDYQRVSYEAIYGRIEALRGLLENFPDETPVDRQTRVLIESEVGRWYLELLRRQESLHQAAIAGRVAISSDPKDSASWTNGPFSPGTK